MGSIVHYWIQEGRDEGIEEGINRGKEEKILMVKEMKKEGISIETILKITKLSKEEIVYLK
ncbi:MAG: transposase [Rickettsia endosymbiont of Argas persicus]